MLGFGATTLGSAVSAFQSSVMDARYRIELPTKMLWGAKFKTSYQPVLNTTFNKYYDKTVHGFRPIYGDFRGAKARKMTNRGDYKVTHTFDDVIGTSRDGAKSKTLTVYLDKDGNVLNSYPTN